MSAIEPLAKKIVLPGAVLYWALEVTLRRLFEPDHVERLRARFLALGDGDPFLKGPRELLRVERFVRGALSRCPPRRWNWIARYARPDECLHVYAGLVHAMAEIEQEAKYLAWTRWSPTVAAAVAGTVQPFRARRGCVIEWCGGLLRESRLLLEWLDRGGHPDLARAIATFDQEGAAFVAAMRDSRTRDANASR